MSTGSSFENEQPERQPVHSVSAFMVEMEHHDFETLRTEAMPWARYMYRTNGGWDAQIREGRFPAAEDGQEVGRGWAVLYGFEERSALILARNYLRNLGEPFQVVSDEAAGGWVLLTNYGQELFER